MHKCLRSGYIFCWIYVAYFSCGEQNMLFSSNVNQIVQGCTFKTWNGPKVVSLLFVEITSSTVWLICLTLIVGALRVTPLMDIAREFIGIWITETARSHSSERNLAVCTKLNDAGMFGLFKKQGSSSVQSLFGLRGWTSIGCCSVDNDTSYIKWTMTSDHITPETIICFRCCHLLQVFAPRFWSFGLAG